MPEVRVQDEQGTVHVFPDGSTPQMIAEAMHVKPPDALPAAANQGAMLNSQLPTFGGVMQGAKQVADDLYTGGVKKFGEGIATISSGLNKLPWIGETLAPKAGVNSFQQQMQPSNTTQKIGGIGEQVGEMALTGGPLKAGAETLATKLPFLGKMAAPLLRVGAEAVNTGGNAALHGEPIGPAAAMGAGGAAVGESLPFVAPALKKSAETQYSKFLNPTKETTKNMTGNIVPELLNRKVVASSGEAMENRAASEMATAGQKISDAVQAFEPPLQQAPTIKGLLQSPQVNIPTGVRSVEGAQAGGVYAAEGRPVIQRGPAASMKQVPRTDTGIGSVAASVPQRIMGEQPAIGAAAYTVPDSVMGPKSVKGTQFLSGGSHPELSGTLQEPADLVTRDPSKLRATYQRLTDVINSPSFSSLSPGEQSLYRSKAAQIGDVLRPGIAPTPQAESARNIIADMERYKQKFIVNGTPVNEAAVANATRLQETVSSLGPDVSFQSINKARQILDSNVARAGAYYGKTLSEGSALDAEKAAANAMRRELARQSPDIAKLNGEYHFWSQVQDVMGATNARRIGQQGPLARIFYPAIGAGAGMVHSGAGGAMEGAAALTIANEVIHHPLFRTSSAIFKNELAKKLAAGDASGVAKLFGRLGASAQPSMLPQNTAGAAQSAATQ